MGVNAAGCDYRDMGVIFLLIIPDHLYNGTDFLVIGCLIVGFFHIIRIRPKLCQLLLWKAKMSSCQRTFHNDKIRDSVVLSIPHPANNHSCFGCGYDRSQFCPSGEFSAQLLTGGLQLCRSCFHLIQPRLHLLISRLHLSVGRLGVFGKRYRQTGSWYNRVGSGTNCLFDPHIVVLGSHHDIETDGSLRCDLSGFLKFPANSPQIGLYKIRGKIRLPKTDLRRGNESHSSCLCHGSCQTVETDSYSHSPLDHRFFHNQVSNY